MPTTIPHLAVSILTLRPDRDDEVGDVIGNPLCGLRNATTSGVCTVPVSPPATPVLIPLPCRADSHRGSQEVLLHEKGNVGADSFGGQPVCPLGSE